MSEMIIDPEGFEVPLRPARGRAKTATIQSELLRRKGLGFVHKGLKVRTSAEDENSFASFVGLQEGQASQWDPDEVWLAPTSAYDDVPLGNEKQLKTLRRNWAKHVSGMNKAAILLQRRLDAGESLDIADDSLWPDTLNLEA